MGDDCSAVIISRHKRYKAGINQVVNWLANTTAQYRDLHPILSNLKDETSPTVRVKTRELLPLAKIITGANAPVPAGIFSVLQDVISGFQGCADWYGSLTAEDGTEISDQNELHAYFIDVLQQIQQFLNYLEVTPGSEISQQSSGKKKGKAAASQADELSILFEYLDVGELAQPSMDQNELSNATIGPQKRQYELDDDLEVVDTFPLWCHLQDMSDTRLFVRDLWLEYRRGEITIDVAGIVTDVAIAMLRRAHDDFVGVYPHLNLWGDVTKFLRLRTSSHKNIVCIFHQSTNGLAVKTPPSPKDNGIRPVDLLCPAASILLDDFLIAVAKYRDELKQLGSKSADKNFRTTFNSRPRNVTALEQPLMSFLPSLGKGILVPNKSSFLDGLLQASNMPSGRGQSMAMVIACQICMDEIVDLTPGCGGDALLRTTSDITANIDGIFMFLREQPTLCAAMSCAVQRFKLVRKLVADYQKVLEHTRVLAQPLARQGLSEKKLIDYEIDKGKHPALDILPHCAGTSAYVLKLKMHDLGTDFANENLVVVLLAHFYKAARKYGLVKAVWHDLDFLVSQHGGEKPLITKTLAKATDPYAMLKHYLIDLGIEASSVPPGTAPPRPTKQTLTQNSGKSKKVEAVSALIHDIPARVFVEMDQFDLVTAVLSTIRTKSDRGTTASKARHFSPTQLLATLKREVISDEPAHNFDYLGFTEVCLTILSNTMTAGLHDMRRKPKPISDSKASTPIVLYDLLKLAADATANGSPLPSAFTAAASKMQEELESMDQDDMDKGTKRFSKAAFDTSSGRISKDLRPEPSAENPSTAADLDEFLKKYPAVSVATGNLSDTFQFYNPAGSTAAFQEMLESGALARFMTQ